MGKPLCVKGEQCMATDGPRATWEGHRAPRPKEQKSLRMGRGSFSPQALSRTPHK